MNRKPEKNPAARAYFRAFYRGNRLRCAAAMLLLLLSVPQNLIGSWLLGEVVDVITSGDVEWLKRTLLFTVVFVAAIFCVNTAMYRVKSTFIHKALAQYKSLAFQNLSEKSISAFSRENTGRYISVLTNDVNSVEENYLRRSFQLVYFVLLFFGALGMMFWYSPVLAAATICLSALPLGMTFDEYMGWYIAGEGEQILNEVISEVADNVVAFPCGVVDSEIFLHSTKPVACLNDMKGLKIRGVSDWANIETILGVSVVSMDGGECYEALSRGTIDGCEYSSPATNWAAGFQEVAPYMTVPGIHQSSAAYLLLINKDVWNDMDEQIQNIIRTSCLAMMAKNWADDRVANAEAWLKFEELADQGKLTIYTLPEEDIQTIKEVGARYYQEKCESNPLFAKIYNSQQAYIQATKSWNEAVEAGK